MHRDQAETSLASKPRFGPQKLTLVLRFLEIIVAVVLFHCPIGVMTQDGGVEVGAEFLCRWRMRLRRSTFGHRSGSPDTLWPILFTHTPFLWDVNMRVTNVAAWRLASVAVAEKTLCPHMNAKSSRRKGVMTELYPVYSPGCRIKKYVIMIMAHSDHRNGSPNQWSRLICARGF